MPTPLTSSAGRPGPTPRRLALAGVLGLAVLACGGCEQGRHLAGSGRGAPAAAATLPAPGAPSPAATSGGPGTSPGPGAAAVPAPSGSSPSGPGSCHARGSGLDVLPDPACTPGAVNPSVTQADIDRTICKAGWTATVRPPERYTEPLKVEQLAAYGEPGPVSGYEEDHLIPLELGGSPASPQNLWPEPGASPNPKDGVENAANHAVCRGAMSLQAAQRAMATDWITLGRQLGVLQGPGQAAPTAGAPPATAPVGGASATCSVTASYDARYADWDVFVHSSQPDQGVTVTAAGGATASWHTDATGYADVYLHAGADAAGQAVTVTVGAARCSGAL